MYICSDSKATRTSETRLGSICSYQEYALPLDKCVSMYQIRGVCAFPEQTLRQSKEPRGIKGPTENLHFNSYIHRLQFEVVEGEGKIFPLSAFSL